MIVVSGSLAYDRIMDFPGKFSDHILPEAIHKLNVSFLVGNLRRGFGGTAGNIAYTLSLLGVKIGILGITGTDFDEYGKFLEKNEVDTRYIKKINKFETSAATGIIDSSNNAIWGYYMGADSLSDQLTIADIKDKIDLGIIAPQNPKAMLKFAREYTQHKIPYLFDPGMQLPWLSGDELTDSFIGALIIIGNDYEISVMEKKTKIDSIHKHYHDKIVITTLGEKGSRISYKDSEFNIKPAVVKNTSDPAGAGDCFRSGFVAGYIRGFPLEVCAQMGSVASAYTVEKYGTTSHYFSIEEFARRYKANYNQDLKL